MPHICLRCKTRLESAPGLAPRCPVCGGTRFSFESARKEEKTTVPPETPEERPVCTISTPDADTRITGKDEETCEPEQPLNAESVESIRILEPGKYNLNLLKLAESDDRVIQVGKDGNYRLDLHSMIRTKKK